MAIDLFLAATLRKYIAGYDSYTGHSMEIAPGITVRQLVQQLQVPEADVKLIMVNGVAAKWETVLKGDERVALFPPVGGG